MDSIPILRVTPPCRTIIVIIVTLYTPDVCLSVVCGKCKMYEVQTAKKHLSSTSYVQQIYIYSGWRIETKHSRPRLVHASATSDNAVIQMQTPFTHADSTKRATLPIQVCIAMHDYVAICVREWGGTGSSARILCAWIALWAGFDVRIYSLLVCSHHIKVSPHPPILRLDLVAATGGLQ